MIRTVIVSILLVLSLFGISQEDSALKKQWYVSVGAGLQISGYKKVDFVSENVASSILFTTGVWLSPAIAVQASYKGYYFHTISDHDQHHFYFLFGEAKFDFIRLITNQLTKHRWQLFLHLGGGYFFNKYYNEPNFCANVGASISYNVYKKIDIYTDLSAVIGWDIYQGDEDILPSINIGITYNFN